jgi:hypothetical protein
MAGTDHEIHVHDMRHKESISRARQIGIRSVPAVIIDGKLAGCCAGGLFGVGRPHVSEPAFSGHSEGVGSSAGLSTDRQARIPADTERIEEELRSEIYASPVGLTFTDGEKAIQVERLCKACCKLNDLAVKRKLNSP